ncbi:hypothetical protein BX600DRAFT_468251 [Xylariales sp. PMI_506]|nr:hypothetical protein BX600DRAFT_468251 [Xylariales sp. PMI_506]
MPSIRPGKTFAADFIVIFQFLYGRHQSTCHKHGVLGCGVCMRVCVKPVARVWLFTLALSMV